MKKNFNLKVCIIGFGSIGRRHASNLLKMGADVILLRSGNTNINIPKFKKKLKTYFNFDDMLNEKPDLIFICNPTIKHDYYVGLSIINNIPFFVEKPIGAKYLKALKFQSQIKKRKLKTCVGYMMRYDVCILKIKELLDKNFLGKVTTAIMEWGSYLPSWHPWENYKHSYAARNSLGGGVIKTCSHEIDLALFLFGDVKKHVCFKRHDQVLNIDVEDHADILLKHRSGVTTFIHLDYFQRKTKRYIEIIGEKGRLSWNYNKRLLEFYNFKKNKRVILAKSKCINNVYKDLTIDFLDSLKKRKNILLDYKQGLNTLKLCEKLKSKIVN